MKVKIQPTSVDATEIYKALSYDETKRLAELVARSVFKWAADDENFHIIDNHIIKELWVTMPPHFIQFDVEIIVVNDPSDVNHTREAYSSYFSGPLKFYNDFNEFLMAQYLISAYKWKHKLN